MRVGGKNGEDEDARLVREVRKKRTREGEKESGY